MIRWLAVALLVVLAACGAKDDAPDPNAFHILAGSEVKDVAPQVIAQAKAAGIAVTFDYGGTLDVIDRVNAGGGDIDAAWVANGAYAALALTAKPAAATKTMYSQIIVGVRPAVAAALGWDKTAPTWAEIAAAAAAGRFRYAMTNPAASNSGLSALVAVASSLGGTGAAVTREVDTVALRGFLKGQALTAGSSGWLAEAFDRDADRLDGMINYESVLASRNATARAPLTLIYPRDGAVTADYPLLLVNPARRADYDKLVAILLAAPAQSAFAATMRRPVDAAVPLARGLRADPAVDLPFPARLDAVDALLFAYLDKLRRPIRSWFVIDHSGSMEGERMTAMKAALTALAGGNATTLAARFARLADRETTTLIGFSGEVDPPRAFAISRADPAPRAALVAAVDGLQADGATAIYDAVAAALTAAVADAARDPGAVHSIVLMTDGGNTAGMEADAFAQFYARLPASKRAVRVFPILFGESDAEAMEALAKLTGGRTFDARKGDLSAVFRDIRGYQ